MPNVGNTGTFRGRADIGRQRVRRCLHVHGSGAGSRHRIDSAGHVRSGQTTPGRVEDFDGDGFIGDTMVTMGTMSLDFRVYPDQPHVLTRNFETEIALEGRPMGSAPAIHQSHHPAID